jgi:energy-coupling factor transporter ATP-binding protein EcfA2
LYEDGVGFRFDFYAAALNGLPHKRLFVDQNFSHARLQLSEELRSRMPHLLSPLGYPLDELLIMHRLTQESAIELHGVGIVGPKGANNLFVGHSGAGKSTTARLWTSLHNVDILSDDRIIVREHNNGEDATQIFMYGTPWHGEAQFALPQRAPLQRIFVLEHGHGNILTRLTPSQTVAELFARAFVPFHRHEYVEFALTFLEHVAESIPCYRYSFEPDERAVEKILQFSSSIQ